MPRELPELKGEPLGFGMLKAQSPGEPESVIEVAVDISDVCPKLRGGIKVHIFFVTSKKIGPGGAVVELTPSGEALNMHFFQVTKLEGEQKPLLEVWHRLFGIEPGVFKDLIKRYSPK